jgi:hypothetical protein
VIGLFAGSDHAPNLLFHDADLGELKIHGLLIVDNLAFPGMHDNARSLASTNYGKLQTTSESLGSV